LLESFGLTDKEANIYIFISKNGAIRSMELTRLTRTDKAEVYRILNGLQSNKRTESIHTDKENFAEMQIFCHYAG
jgi:sugar-specific transcriptional regulator TrmB